MADESLFLPPAICPPSSGVRRKHGGAKHLLRVAPRVEAKRAGCSASRGGNAVVYTGDGFVGGAEPGRHSIHIQSGMKAPRPPLGGEDGTGSLRIRNPARQHQIDVAATCWTGAAVTIACDALWGKRLRERRDSVLDNNFTEALLRQLRSPPLRWKKPAPGRKRLNRPLSRRARFRSVPRPSRVSPSGHDAARAPPPDERGVTTLRLPRRKACAQAQTMEYRCHVCARDTLRP